MSTKTGAELIAAERTRQIEVEKWDAKHDDEHSRAEMLAAALAYSVLAQQQFHSRKPDQELVCSLYWPWSKKWWKPSKDPIRNLVKAGALIAAEIDRLQRIKSAPPSAPSDPK